MTVAHRAYAAIQRNPGMTLGWVLGFVLIAFVGLRGENTRDKVVKVVNSPCIKNVGGKPCQRTKRRSDEERSVSSTCVLFYKVDKGGELLRFTKCPVNRPRGPGLKTNAPAASSGGDASTGLTGTLQPGPREGGSSEGVKTGKPRGGGGSGGHGKPPAGSPTTPDPAPVPSASSPSPSPGRSSDAPGDPEPKGDPPGALPSTLEATGGAVKEAGEGVGGAVEGVGKGVDCALRGGC